MADESRIKFYRDSAAISKILKSPEVAAALNPLGSAIVAEIGEGARLETYVTDRQVVAVVLDPEDQAVDGAATKALGKQGMTLE